MTRRKRDAAPSVIAHDVVVEGHLASKGKIDVDGVVNGDVRAVALTVGPDAEVNGSVIADAAIIHGKVRGALRVRELRLCETARVEGPVVHSMLSVEPGALIKGEVIHVEDSENLEAITPALPAPAAPAKESAEASAEASEESEESKSAEDAEA